MDMLEFRLREWLYLCVYASVVDEKKQQLQNKILFILSMPKPIFSFFSIEKSKITNQTIDFFMCIIIN